MKRIELTITAEAPLAIGQRKPGASVSEATDYIPGTVIRGAIASQMIQQAQAAGQISTANADLTQTNDDFGTLFLNDDAAIFHNAYPAIAKTGEDEYAICPEEVRVLPATALSSKTSPGFKPKGSGVFDSLLDSFCARGQGHFYEPNDLKGDRVEPFSGFYSKHGEHCYSHSVSKRLLTRVGINRRRATAEEQILYSIEVLNEVQGKAQPQPTVYKSSILVEDDTLADQLCQFIRQNGDRFRLGGSISRGLGKVKICAKLQDVSNPVEAIKEQIERFNTLLGDRWRLWSVLSNGQVSIEGRTFFTLDLQSDAILTENWQRTMVISEAMLHQLPDVTNADITLHMAYSSYDYRSGWNAAWGLQKDVELVTNIGSVYLFSTQDPEQWYEPLARLESWGVGDRTSEGFGRIKICDEFHQIVRETAV